MTRPVRTRIEGARELDRFLKRLPKFMRQKELEGALMTGSNPLRKRFIDAAAARQRAEVMGILQRAVTRRKMRRSAYSAQVLVGWFRRGFYARFEEERSPFARPAWESVQREVLDTFGKALGDRLIKAARRIAGPYARSGLNGRSRSRRHRR